MPDMSNKDPKGFYACLGMQHSASAQEIKTAYRRLAKIHHPDTNSHDGSKTRFQAIQAAYYVLSYLERRGEYDSSGYSAAASEGGQNSRLEPIHCSKCAKVTAQPRYVVFYQVISLIVVTLSTPTQGIFCSSCARNVAFRASAVSAFMGWWAVPWGPLLTVTNIFKNAFGGSRPREVEERLIWYNALAFLSSGNLSLAHALARRLRTAADETIAINALRLIDRLHAMGVPASAAVLANPWRPKVPQVLGHVLLACAIPLFIVWFNIQDQGRPAESTMTSSRQSKSATPEFPKSEPTSDCAAEFRELTSRRRH